MPNSIELFIPCVPTAKGRPRVVRKKNGSSHTYTPDKTVCAEEVIRWHLRQHKVVPFEAGLPLRVTATFCVPRPKAAKKTAVHPCKRPDLDQYVKLLFDACNGFCWADDSQVVAIDGTKRYDVQPGIFMKVEVL